MKIIISFLIWLLICLPLTIIGLPITAILLLTKWTGYTTPWGNPKWGRGTKHPDHATKNYWQEFNWLALRNPVNNLNYYLSAKQRSYKTKGNRNIGDKIAGGLYEINMYGFWEIYYIKPYLKTRCIRLRAGWKIKDNKEARAAFVFAFNPVKSYSGK